MKLIYSTLCLLLATIATAQYNINENANIAVRPFIDAIRNGNIASGVWIAPNPIKPKGDND